MSFSFGAIASTSKYLSIPYAVEIVFVLDSG